MSTPLPLPACLRDQEEERLRVALEGEHLRPGGVREELEPVAEAERRGVLAIGGAEVADEARDDVTVRPGERVEERRGVCGDRESCRRA